MVMKMRRKLRSMAFIMAVFFTVSQLLFVSAANISEYPGIKVPTHMSDGEFFGVWDVAQNSWSIQPKLRYDLYEGLSGVCTQAKKGDYTKAEDELLSYYRARTGVPEYKLPGDNNPLYADAMSEKIYGWMEVDSAVGVTAVKPEWQYYTVDLNVSPPVPTSFYLLDSDMDGSAVEIYSRRSAGGEYGAKLEVVVNGEKKTFPVVADTYISAGDNRSKNFGDSPILYAREAAGSEENPFGSDTARPYFRFDVGQLTGNISSVKLSFYARSNNGADKKIFVFRTGNEKQFDEKTFVWAKHYPQIFNFKETGFIWDSGMVSRWNLDAEWINAVSRLYQVGWLIPHYKATGNELYAYRALEIAMSLYEQQNRAFFPRDLEAGWRTEYLCILLFGTLNSSSITPELFAAQLKYMYLHMDALKDVGTVGAFNQVSAKLCGFLRLAGYVPELAQDEWWELVKDKMKTLYASYLNNDGSYTEATSGYMGGVVTELRTALELIALRDGEEDPYYNSLLEFYRKLVKYIFDMAMPYGRTTPYGDGPRLDSKTFCYNEYRLYPEVDPNGHFEYFATEGQFGNEPDYTSTVYKDKAIAFLKSGWLPEDFGATICANFGGTHSHYGDLGLDVSAYGAPLLVEAGGASYSQGSLMSGVANKTYSHNTIEIDKKNQAGYDYGNLSTNQPQKLLLATNGLFDFVEAGSDKIYPGFDVNRKVLFLHNSYWIVSDYITPPEGTHVYKQAWRPDTRNNLTLAPETKAATTHYENRPNIQVVPADPEKSEARIEKSYMNSPTDSEQLTDYVRYCREDVSGPQTFDTVLYPDRQGNKTYVSVQRIGLDGVQTIDATALKIDIGLNTGFYYSSNELVPPVRAFDRFITDGQMAYVELDPKDAVSVIALTKSKTLKQGDVEIVSSKEVLPDLGVKWSADTLQLFTESGTLPSSGVKIYAGRPVSRVMLNGIEVSFTYAGNSVSTNGLPQ